MTRSVLFACLALLLFLGCSSIPIPRPETISKFAEENGIVFLTPQKDASVTESSVSIVSNEEDVEYLLGLNYTRDSHFEIWEKQRAVKVTSYQFDTNVFWRKVAIFRFQPGPHRIALLYSTYRVQGNQAVSQWYAYSVSLTVVKGQKYYVELGPGMMRELSQEEGKATFSKITEYAVIESAIVNTNPANRQPGFVQER